jgi:hypothetical protein
MLKQFVHNSQSFVSVKLYDSITIKNGLPSIKTEN